MSFVKLRKWPAYDSCLRRTFHSTFAIDTLSTRFTSQTNPNCSCLECVCIYHMYWMEEIVGDYPYIWGDIFSEYILNVYINLTHSCVISQHFPLLLCQILLKLNWAHILVYSHFNMINTSIHYLWSIYTLPADRLLDSLVVECWRRVWEVPGSIPSQGPRHTKDVIKMVPVVPLFSTQHRKGNTGSFSRIR